MKNLDELLKETEFTQDEWETYRKVQKNYQLQDLEYLLDEMLELGIINEETYCLAKEKAGIIVAKYDKWLEYDWRETMNTAIDWVVKGD